MTSIDDDDNVGGLGVVGIKWAAVQWQNDVIAGGRGHTTGGGEKNDDDNEDNEDDNGRPPSIIDLHERTIDIIDYPFIL